MLNTWVPDRRQSKTIECKKWRPSQTRNVNQHQEMKFKKKQLLSYEFQSRDPEGFVRWVTQTSVKAAVRDWRESIIEFLPIMFSIKASKTFRGRSLSLPPFGNQASLRVVPHSLAIRSRTSRSCSALIALIPKESQASSSSIFVRRPLPDLFTFRKSRKKLAVVVGGRNLFVPYVQFNLVGTEMRFCN